MSQMIENLFRVIEEFVTSQPVRADKLINQIPAGPAGPLPPAGNTGSGYSTADHNHTDAGDGGKLTNPALDGYAVLEEIAAPSAPAANTARLYAKDVAGTTELFYKNSAGTERDLSATGGGAPSGSAGGDLGGTYPNPDVVAIDGVAVSGTPTTGDVLTATGASAATWQAPAGGGSGVAPASFYAHKNNTDQSVTNSTFTKVTFGTESWDTGGYWASDTFTPTVAGKYEITVALTWDANGAYRHYVTLYKNGTRFRETITHSAFAGSFTALATFLIDMNGSTDTIEIYCYQNSGGTRTLTGDPLGTWIFGKRVE